MSIDYNATNEVPYKYRDFSFPNAHKVSIVDEQSFVYIDSASKAQIYFPTENFLKKSGKVLTSVAAFNGTMAGVDENGQVWKFKIDY